MNVDSAAELAIQDEEIVKMVQAGDGNSFGILVDRYESKLLRYGHKFLSRQEDIEDIVQDAFVSAYQNIKGFNTDERFSPWMYRIAHNAFVNELRRNKYKPFLVDFDTFISHPVYEDPEEFKREQKDMRILIDKGLEHLEQKYREVLVLHYFEEMSYKDIAEILRIPAGTVSIRLKRAKEALKKNFKETP
ncbi:MAG: RNA polymerase sigma factor [Chitinophagaceae bacterium]